MKNLFVCIISLFFANLLLAQLPQRKAQLGLMGKSTPEGLLIDSIIPGSSGAKSGLKKGDLLVKVNGISMLSVNGNNQIKSLDVRAGEKFSLTYSRKKKEKTVDVTAVAKPFLQVDYADVSYDWVKFRSGYLRAITYRPKNALNVPAILLVPGYGCGSVENYPGSYNGKLIRSWVENGFAVVTVEKSGVGDSWDCEPCQEVDLATDIESFDLAYQYMEELPFVDKANLFIWGHSMGGTIAPEIAKRHTPRGVMVFGCVFRPWSEFLPEMHRVQKPLMEGMSYTDTEDFVRLIHRVYDAFFIDKLSVEELHAKPEFKAIVESEFGYKPGNNDLWGRHWRFWQQLDSVNMAESWSLTNCPVLVLHGGTDYEQCSAVEPLMIRETVNSLRPGTATMITIPNLDHFMMISKDWKEAYEHFQKQEFLKGNFNQAIADETVKWLRLQVGN